MAGRAPKRRRGVRPTFVMTALLLGVIGAAVILMLTHVRGQALLVRWGVTDRFLPQLEVHLDVALAERFLEMGLLSGDLRAQGVVKDGVTLQQYRFRAPAHLTPTQCNLWIVRAVVDVGADVLRAEENHRRDGEITIWLGFGRHLTHRVVVQPQAPEPESTSEPAPRVAIVIDDLGHNMGAVTRGILGLDVPLTIAVLPDLSSSREAFLAAERAGFPTLLHLPMEPNRKIDPGRNPIKVGMKPDEIEALIDRHYRNYQTFIGINNHMGSRATSDKRTMRAVMTSLQRRGLFFFDSLTSPRSVGYKTAREHGLWSIRNDLFLDDRTRAAETVADNLLQLCELARQRGLAVGIAHPRPYTLTALRALLPRMQAEGIEFVTLEDLRQESQTAAQTAGS